MYGERDPSAVVADLNSAVVQQGDLDGARVAVRGLVGGVATTRPIR
jgi:hypothetical protein